MYAIDIAKERAHAIHARPSLGYYSGRRCTFFGTESMLRQIIRRAKRLVSPARLLTVITHPHLPYAQEELGDRALDTVLIQPCNRETAPGILLPILHVQQRDPDAIVALLPSDHFVLGEERFMDAVATAAAFVRREPGRLALLGVAPTQPEIDYGWMEAGDEIGQEQRQALYQVSRFWEKPSLTEAQMLYRQGYVWNTMVVVGRVSMFVTLFHMQTPPLLNAFESLKPVLGSQREAAVRPGAYAAGRTAYHAGVTVTTA